MTTSPDPGQQGWNPPQRPDPGGFPPPAWMRSDAEQDDQTGSGASSVATRAAPGAVRAAFWISVLTPLITTVLFAVGMFVMVTAMVGELSSTGASPQLLNSTRLGGYATSGVLIFLYAVLTALWIVFGLQLLSGRNGARITLTVLAVFWVLFGLISLGNGAVPFTGGIADTTSAPVAVAMLVTGHGLGVAGAAGYLLLVWTPRSHEYFRSAW